MTTPRYTQDNTDGYTDAQLAELCRRYEDEIERLGLDPAELDATDESAISERIVTNFDSELTAAAAR